MVRLPAVDDGERRSVARLGAAVRRRRVGATGRRRLERVWDTVRAVPTRDMHVAIVSTYPPRACGIGTFSRDLREALLGADGVAAVDVVAIVRDEGHDQAPEVVTRIDQDQRGDYAAAARVLERRGDDVVSSSTSTASSAGRTARTSCRWRARGCASRWS